MEIRFFSIWCRGMRNPRKGNIGVEVSTGASIECSFASFISACNWNSTPTINFSFSLDWFQQFLSAFGSLVLIISLFIQQSGRRDWRNWRRVRPAGSLLAPEWYLTGYEAAVKGHSMGFMPHCCCCQSCAMTWRDNWYISVLGDNEPYRRSFISSRGNIFRSI